MTVQPARVGLIGCGNVSQHYVAGCASLAAVDLVACTDADPARAAALAATAGLRALALDDLLGDPSIDVVVNLTPPVRHTEVSLAAIAAGKHVYSEKPLATTLADARAIVDAAAARGVRLGCAPDTFLGGGLQTARAVLDAGSIGEPLGAHAAVLTLGLSAGTRTRRSSSRAAAARCSTSGRTTSPRSSTCSARSPRSRRSAAGTARSALSGADRASAPGSPRRCRRTSSPATASCRAWSPRSSIVDVVESGAPHLEVQGRGIACDGRSQHVRGRGDAAAGGREHGRTCRSVPTAGRAVAWASRT